MFNEKVCPLISSLIGVALGASISAATSYWVTERQIKDQEVRQIRELQKGAYMEFFDAFDRCTSTIANAEPSDRTKARDSCIGDVWSKTRAVDLYGGANTPQLMWTACDHLYAFGTNGSNNVRREDIQGDTRAFLAEARRDLGLG